MKARYKGHQEPGTVGPRGSIDQEHQGRQESWEARTGGRKDKGQLGQRAVGIRCSKVSWAEGTKGSRTQRHSLFLSWNPGMVGKCFVYAFCTVRKWYTY